MDNNIDFCLKQVYDLVRNQKIKFEIIIRDQREIHEINSILKSHNFKIDYSLKPLFQENIAFFKENVFFDKKDICNQHLTTRGITLNKLINKYYYKKLFVLPNGFVHSNLNKESLGNISECSITECIIKEVTNCRNWFEVRKNYQPCKSCIYNLLCPPISNYEYVIGKKNLCNIHCE